MVADQLVGLGLSHVFSGLCLVFGLIYNTRQVADVFMSAVRSALTAVLCDVMSLSSPSGGISVKLGTCERPLLKRF